VAVISCFRYYFPSMKSIKPGRGPSAMAAIGSVVGIVFGVFWTALAYEITKSAPFPLVHVVFPLFGLLFIGGGIASLIYNTANATGKNRMSVFDITDGQEESDPAANFLRRDASKPTPPASTAAGFCPSCGAALQAGYKFCPSCGKAL
jgi:hypothetical protein